MIRVQCPHCQRRYRTEMEAFGRTAVCTKCSRAFKIGESRPPFQWKNTDLAEDSWIGVPEPEEKQEMKHCIICDAPLRPQMVSCPECGANQVTGIVHRSRPRAEERDASIWSAIPVRLIVITLAVFVVGAGIYWGAKMLGRKGVQLGDELADTTRINQVARQLDSGEDEADLAGKCAGYVKDSNIERFARMLATGAPNQRRATVVLIGAGDEMNLAPVVASAKAQDANTAAAGMAALEAVGPRRMVELSNHDDEKIRGAAVDALAMLFDLDRAHAKVAQLSKPMPAAQKIGLLNEICRPWPELLGFFVVTINEVPSPFVVQIEQIGKSFYLKAGEQEFVSTRGVQRFTIPIHRWCMATGSAVDGRSVRDLVGGSVIIVSSFGARWQGEVTVNGRRRITGPLPGLLPFDAPAPGQTARAALRLDRPSRPG